MENLQQIRRRISSVTNTQKITRAMKLVAAAKLRRAQMAAENSRPFIRGLDQMVSSVLASIESPVHPLLVQGESKDVLLIAISADRGLCGGFNANLFRKTNELVTEMDGDGRPVSLLPVGRKVCGFAESRELKLADQRSGFSERPTYDDALSLAEAAMEWYCEDRFGEVWLLYYRFETTLRQQLLAERLLPFSLKQQEDEEPPGEYIFEPSAEAVLEKLLPQLVKVKIYTSLLESAASELASRMMAMDSATTNARDMIQSLTLTYNKARQASITKELIEVVSGVEALKG